MLYTSVNMRIHAQRLLKWGGLSCLCLTIMIIFSKQSQSHPHTQHHVKQRHYHRYTHRSITKANYSGYKLLDVFWAVEQEELQEFDYDEEIELDEETKRLVRNKWANRQRPRDHLMDVPIIKPKRDERLEKTGVSREIETYITYRIDDSISPFLEVTRCAKLDYPAQGGCLVPSIPAKPHFNLTIWTQDYHPAAVQGLKLLLQPFGVTFLDKSLSQYCRTFNSCGTDLRGIETKIGINLQEDTIQTFQAEYIKDSQFASVDAFLCIRPPAMCELFMPFGKGLLVIIDSRFELGRFTLERWGRWIQNLLIISQDTKNVVAVTSEYDAQYVQYYTGYRPNLLPPVMHYILNKYQHKTTKHFLLYPLKSSRLHRVFKVELAKWMEAEGNYTVKIIDMRREHTDETAENLVKYAGIIVIPQEPSSLRMTELYRMNIPLFAPSPELLTRWHIEFSVMDQRTWAGITRFIPWSAGAKMPGKLSLPNPNDVKIDSVGFWMSFIDIYVWPHIIYFNNARELLIKMELYSRDGKLREVSESMVKQNTKEISQTGKKWIDILRKLQADKTARHTVL